MSICIFRIYTVFSVYFKGKTEKLLRVKVPMNRERRFAMFGRKNSRTTDENKIGELPSFEARTDLAVEEQESFAGDGGEIKGVALREWHHRNSHIRMTEVSILDERGAKAMGKPMGTYLTLDVPDMAEKDDGYHEEVADELGKQLNQLIRKMCPQKKEQASILVVGLGNIQVTPDSLGPRVVDNLQMTRHFLGEYGDDFCEKNKLPVLSGIVPGVMAQTGMETAEIVKGIVEETKPDMVLAIDALAARNVRRLASTIQLTDTGIHPGSGVGNHRHSMTKESLGVPVAALGIPTVVGAAAIVHGTVEALIHTLALNSGTEGYAKYMEDLDPESQYELIRELMEPEFGPMFVTPQDIDERVKQLSFTVSEGIHRALYGKKE